MKEWGEDDDDEEGEEVEKAAAVEPDMEDIKVFHGDGTAVTEDFSHINGIAKLGHQSKVPSINETTDGAGATSPKPRNKDLQEVTTIMTGNRKYLVYKNI